MFSGAPSVTAQDWHQVARRMHNSNGIIGARSASQLPPDSVATMGNKCLCSSASLPSHYNQKYRMRSNIFVLDRILSQSGTSKRCLLKTTLPMKFSTDSTDDRERRGVISIVCVSSRTDGRGG